MTVKNQRWVTCSKAVNANISATRHVLNLNSDVTLCGATGLGEGVWRGNWNKPACPTCTERLQPTTSSERLEALLAPVLEVRETPGERKARLELQIEDIVTEIVRSSLEDVIVAEDVTVSRDERNVVLITLYGQRWSIRLDRA